MLGLSRLLGPFLYPYSRAFPLPHLTIISTILLPDLPFYRPPDSLLLYFRTLSQNPCFISDSIKFFNIRFLYVVPKPEQSRASQLVFILFKMHRLLNGVVPWSISILLSKIGCPFFNPVQVSSTLSIFPTTSVSRYELCSCTRRLS